LLQGQRSRSGGRNQMREWLQPLQKLQRDSHRRKPLLLLLRRQQRQRAGGSRT
jgi:hypothetical protein